MRDTRKERSYRRAQYGLGDALCRRTELHQFIKDQILLGEYVKPKHVRRGKKWLAAHRTLKVGYLNTYLPYSDTDSSGQVTGLVSELLPHMFDELGTGDISLSYLGYDNYDDMIRDISVMRYSFRSPA